MTMTTNDAALIEQVRAQLDTISKSLTILPEGSLQQPFMAKHIATLTAVLERLQQEGELAAKTRVATAERAEQACRYAVKHQDFTDTDPRYIRGFEVAAKVCESAIRMHVLRHETEDAYRVTHDLARSLSTAVPPEQEDTRRLRWVLRNASLTMTEDGDCVGLFLRSHKDERAFAIVAECTGEDGLTEDDAPWLTPEQRASINGLPPSPTGCVTDPTTIRQAIDAAMQSEAPAQTKEKCVRCNTILTYKQREVCDACLMASESEMGDRA